MKLSRLSAAGLAGLFDRMCLVEINVRNLGAVQQRFGQRPAEFEKSQLARPIDQGRQFDCKRTAVSYFKDYGAAPAGLNPRRCLMHAETDSRVRASAFNQADQIIWNLYCLVSWNENEAVRFQDESFSCAKVVKFGEFGSLPKTGLT